MTVKTLFSFLNSLSMTTQFLGDTRDKVIKLLDEVYDFFEDREEYWELILMLGAKVKNLWGLYTFFMDQYNSSQINSIIETYSQEINWAPKGKKLFMLVGLSGSGKTHLRKNNPLYKKLFCIESNRIHDMLHDAFPQMSDDTLSSTDYFIRQWLTAIITAKVLQKACEAKVSVVLDNCNLDTTKRLVLLNLAKQHHRYMTGIIFVDTPDKVIVQRLKARSKSAKELELWLALHEQQKQTLADNPVSAKEADMVIRERSLL